MAYTLLAFMHMFMDHFFSFVGLFLEIEIFEVIGNYGVSLLNTLNMRRIFDGPPSSPPDSRHSVSRNPAWQSAAADVFRGWRLCALPRPSCYRDPRAQSAERARAETAKVRAQGAER
jgi:hypothetical protein